MKYVMAFARGIGRAQRPLEDGSTRESIANDCRDAALAFMAGVPGEWTKRELATWLAGAYANAVRHAKQGERVADDEAREELAPTAVEQLLVQVHAQLLVSLERASVEIGILEFSEESIAREHVKKVVDAEGHPAWIPVDGPRLRLRDRLRSLFAADYLNRPYTYGELFVCQRCEIVVFDEHLKPERVCGLHRTSDVVPRAGDTTVAERIASGDDRA